ncbi:hypothetical protein HYV84_07290 [Candidatus Woesearchaeota archaeon]|nr:hypothetical protein [Candidatus Woesearchaeota archaeon]
MRVKGVSHIAYFTHGKRGNLYTGIFKGRKIVIKSKRPESEALGRIENEIRFLKILNEEGIGPKLLFWDKRKFSYFGYAYVDGVFFPQFLERCGRKDKSKVSRMIADIFSQCYTLDKLGINKEEMSHPQKHIIIGRRTKRPVLIDFERCHYTEKPGNVTQFTSYLLSNLIHRLLKGIGLRFTRKGIISSAKAYHKKGDRKNFDKIISSFSLSS